VRFQVLTSISETSVNFYETTQRSIPEGYLHTSRRENLKSHLYTADCQLHPSRRAEVRKVTDRSYLAVCGTVPYFRGTSGPGCAWHSALLQGNIRTWLCVAQCFTSGEHPDLTVRGTVPYFRGTSGPDGPWHSALLQGNIRTWRCVA
jgi:hypothetical protein